MDYYVTFPLLKHSELICLGTETSSHMNNKDLSDVY